ncbi:MAG: hypothetical protein ABIP30_05880 [Ferruginibacter sp.]
MKIGFIGNTNNYPFILAQKLIEEGHEILFIVDEKSTEKLHRPENHVLKIDYPYPDWIKEDLFPINIIRVLFPKIFSKSVIRKLNSCDAVIINGLWHGIKLKLKDTIPSVSVFSGADLDVYASYKNFKHFFFNHPKTKYLPGFILKWLIKEYVNNHRAGIREACCISYFPPGAIPEGDEIIREIFTGKEDQVVRFSHCHVNTENINYTPPPENTPLKILNVARFVWKQPLPPGYNQAEAKGNDIMIHGLALFLKEYKIKLDIHFIEKGIHVDETKMLIKEYGFEDMVTWHKEISFSNFMDFLCSGDIIFEQLGNHIFSGGLYPMLIGRPVIANGRPEIFEKFTGEVSPLCQATTAEDVKVWLGKLINNADYRRDIGIESRKYVLKHFDIKDEALFFAKELRKNILV